MPESSLHKSKERRSEPREHTAGQMTLWPEGFPKASQARMLDRSPHGFRASHDCRALTTNQEVHFVYGRIQGRARLVWTRIVGDHDESGFFILSETKARPRPLSRAS